LDTRIVVRHTDSGRDNQVQEFPFSYFRQVTIGRDPSCEIRYDAERDDLVSRQHARIDVRNVDPPEVEITDLNSRNGTFINKRRIASPTRSSAGDMVQLGASGPVLSIPSTRRLFFGQTGTGTKITSLTPKEIAATSTDSVVFFEVGWKLIDTESGHQVSQVYLPNVFKDNRGKFRTLVQGAGRAYIPIFVVVDNQMEPMLTTNSEPHLHAIGGQHSGTGFVVSSDGFVLTNRHVAATWNTAYHWPPEDHYGLLVVLAVDPSTDKFILKKMVPITAAQFPRNWVPQHAKCLLDGSFDPDSERNLSNTITGKTLDGRNDYLDITFAKNRLRVPGRLTRVSDTADVAMVKLDLPQSVHKVELNDNYNRIRPGDPITVMGYPAVSPPVYGIVASRDPFNSGQSAHIIPDPTIGVGNIARVIRGQSTPSVTEAVES
jgi:FHA domain/Trypsin-like peptidase domain